MVLQSENAFLTLPNGQETKKIRLAAGYFLFLTASRFPFDWKFVEFTSSRLVFLFLYSRFLFQLTLLIPGQAGAQEFLADV